jgi:hypothetical protein
VGAPWDPRRAILRLAVEKPGAEPREVNAQPWCTRWITTCGRSAIVTALRYRGLLEPAPGRGNSGGLKATDLGVQALGDRALFDRLFADGRTAENLRRWRVDEAARKRAAS